MAEGRPFVANGELYDIREAFSHCAQTDALFDRAMNEALSWHRKRCPDFAAFLSRKGFENSSSHVRPEEIPPIFVTIFKENRLVSIPDEKVKIELTSSGTTGQKSAIVLDYRSHKRILKIVFNIFDSLGLTNDREKVNYIAFAYDPKIAKDNGSAFSDKLLTGMTKKGMVYYSIKWNKASASFEFDLDACIKRLISFSRRPEPIRLLGFPAYLWQVCKGLEARGINLCLGSRASIVTGGGWKIHKDQEVKKEVYKAEVARILGMPQENIRDLFGMVEHGVPYVDCEVGRMHVPIYSRVRILDPETLSPLPHGTPGLMQLMTPYLSSYPSISILTTDLAVLEPDCPCGRAGLTVKILGRAGLTKHKGCAITALELLKS